VSLKPESIALSATAVDSEEHLTSPGSALDTAAYVSPEQVEGKEMDARSEVRLILKKTTIIHRSPLLIKA
jgi:hypothetical protein